MIFPHLKAIFPNLLISLIFISFLSACSVKDNAKPDPARSNQLGDMLQVYLSNSKQNSQDIDLALAEYDNVDIDRDIVLAHQEEIKDLFQRNILALNRESNDTAMRNALSGLSQSEAFVLFKLFPEDSVLWLRKISSYSNLNKQEIYQSAIAAGIDPTVTFSATKSGLANSITPLINSIGIVLYGQQEENIATVKFKKQNETVWQKGLDLSWEPFHGALAGSIVYLEANTTYHLEVTITDDYGHVVEHEFQTTTKPNTPPIDPNKVFYLSEIYSGGQLDLEALNIEGSAIGYAKIIGDGPIIEVGSDVLAAVNIGNNSYVMLENLTVKGGQRYGIFAKKAHHIWIKGCNVSEYGREAVDIRNGVAYSSTANSSPINYDSGIYLERSGIAVIEECEVHSPNLGANSWAVGHPKGANALQVWAYHDSDKYRGEFIVRNNRFYGTPNHRFNDVIEGRKNFERRGGFVKNSAIYGNYLAYANDDLIEIDGGQQNVLVYDNIMEQGYTGVSIAPNMLGPSYIFHNHIYNLGDERGKEWTAIKAGGLIAKPAGRTFVFENYINVKRNGIAASKVNGDTTFWVTSQNNIYFTKNTGYSVGYCIFDKEKYIGSTSTNDLCFNSNTSDARFEFDMSKVIEHPKADDLDFINDIKNSDDGFLSIPSKYQLENVTRK